MNAKVQFIPQPYPLRVSGESRAGVKATNALVIGWGAEQGSEQWCPIVAPPASVGPGTSVALMRWHLAASS